MGVLRAVIEPYMLPMLNAWHHYPLCGSIAGEFVGDRHAGHDALLLKQLAPQALGGCRSWWLWLAKLWPNFIAHCRTVSWLTRMPRAASISSTIRRLKGKRKYNHTAWLIS